MPAVLNLRPAMSRIRCRPRRRRRHQERHQALPPRHRADLELPRPGPAPARQRPGHLPRRRTRRHLPIPRPVRRQSPRLPPAIAPQEAAPSTVTAEKTNHADNADRTCRRPAERPAWCSTKKRQGVLDAVFEDLVSLSTSAGPLRPGTVFLDPRPQASSQIISLPPRGLASVHLSTIVRSPLIASGATHRMAPSILSADLRRHVRWPSNAEGEHCIDDPAFRPNTHWALASRPAGGCCGRGGSGIRPRP
jgi:hypothetical protein